MKRPIPGRPRRRSGAAVLLAALALNLSSCQTPASVGILPPNRQPAVNVCFSPGGGCTDLIVGTLSQARDTVRVQAYALTSRSIAQALVDAHRRGVRTEVILDQSQQRGPGVQTALLAQAGVAVRVDAAHAVADDNVMVIDGHTVITGSFEFTDSAEERNAENLVVIRDRALATRYEVNWEEHHLHAEGLAQ